MECRWFAVPVVEPTLARLTKAVKWGSAAMTSWMMALGSRNGTGVAWMMDEGRAVCGKAADAKMVEKHMT